MSIICQPYISLLLLQPRCLVIPGSNSFQLLIDLRRIYSPDIFTRLPCQYSRAVYYTLHHHHLSAYRQTLRNLDMEFVVIIIRDSD
jgi:hypothetical protein